MVSRGAAIAAALLAVLLLALGIADTRSGEGDADADAEASLVVAGDCRPVSASIARDWNDAILDAIRLDEPAPTVHSRNLYHLSATMWDVWVAFDDVGSPLYIDSPQVTDDVEAARREAMAHAAHTVLTSRYRNAEGRLTSLAAFDELLSAQCGADMVATSPAPDSAAAFGVDVATEILDVTFTDGSLERLGYEDTSYRPVNPALVLGGERVEMVDPNRWQPLDLEVAIAQNGVPLPGGEQRFIGPNWGEVTPFAIEPGGGDAPPLDPGPPPLLGGEGDAEFRQDVVAVIEASSWLVTGEVDLDIGPASRGDRAGALAAGTGTGPATNPVTGTAYEPNVVDRADYLRAIAEFWADGPDSETPPGHWNRLANDASDALDADALRIGGEGPPVSRLEWDVKLYVALNGALHDAAIAGWGAKRHYDYVRPVSIIRHMGGLGQSSDPDGVSYHPDGLPLVVGLIEVITEETTSSTGYHAHLRGLEGRIAIRTWKGGPADPENEVSGVDWIPATDWLPYQRPTFVTPSFAAYVSGHSIFSRTGAEMLERFTGSAWFPGGLGEHVVPVGSLLHEEGPTETIVLQWATWAAAADEAGYSRIPGGIHLPIDDIAGRAMGIEVAAAGWARAGRLFEP